MEWELSDGFRDSATPMGSGLRDKKANPTMTSESKKNLVFQEKVGCRAVYSGDPECLESNRKSTSVVFRTVTRASLHTLRGISAGGSIQKQSSHTSRTREVTKFTTSFLSCSQATVIVLHLNEHWIWLILLAMNRKTWENIDMLVNFQKMHPWWGIK